MSGQSCYAHVTVTKSCRRECGTKLHEVSVGVRLALRFELHKFDSFVIHIDIIAIVIDSWYSVPELAYKLTISNTTVGTIFRLALLPGSYRLCCALLYCYYKRGCARGCLRGSKINEFHVKPLSQHIYLFLVVSTTRRQRCCSTIGH